jgi:hypothetical protein
MPCYFSEPFSSEYRTHLKHIKPQGLQSKTINAYARAIRRMGACCAGAMLVEQRRSVHPPTRRHRNKVKSTPTSKQDKKIFSVGRKLPLRTGLV